MHDKMNAMASAVADVFKTGSNIEQMDAHGVYEVECRDADGNLKWRDKIENVVCNEGKNFALDQILGGTAFVACFMGLISSVSYSGVPVVGDTMASHATWTEAGGANAPTFANRGTPAFSAASGGSKQTSSATSFTMTGAGTLKGCFIVIGTGAVNTVGSTAGRLLSAGLFSGGDKVVASTDVVNVTYTLSM